ncbi:MAG: class I SAM-dependent methyltransferase [Actinomycetota bacterium]|nr:class I SAM-dependent methyltransferase [Actinomycetota bacterium]MDA2947752.1 class I SAM-dependent methyltransferase [Actinomycetota bacterium]MDA2989941.1 class I SAM-dependent methyltransferase [Actinomycetota bacterium]
MTSSDIWDAATAAAYEDDSAEQFLPDVIGPAVDLLADLAGSGRALGFAIGTGRLGIPLLSRGIAVTGIELSAAMIARLREKVSEADLPVTLGDMATTVVPGEFSLVFLPWNSLSNLKTQQEQVECFRNAARHLVPGGRFVIELWVPPLRRLPPGQTAVPFDISDSHVGFDTYDIARQMCTSHHYTRDKDGSLRYRNGEFRYVWPAECDLMAQLAGLEFESRFADWRRSPFTGDSENHISVWRKPAPDAQRGQNP